MGAAAGLAAGGKIPFVNTMATFASHPGAGDGEDRPRLQRLPVRIVGHPRRPVGRPPRPDPPQPRRPGDHADAARVDRPGTRRRGCHREAVRQCLDLPGPVYIRGWAARPTPPLIDAGPIRIGQAQPLRHGRRRADRVPAARTRCWPRWQAARPAGRPGRRGRGAQHAHGQTARREADRSAAQGVAGGDHRRGALAHRRAWQRGCRDAGRATADAAGPDRRCRTRSSRSSATRSTCSTTTASPTRRSPPWH